MTETYEVTQEQHDKIMALSDSEYPLLTLALANRHDKYSDLLESISTEEELAFARYIGGDERILFVVKEQAYTWSVFGNGVRYAITKFNEPKNSLLTGSYGITDMSKSVPVKLTKSEVIDLGFDPDMFTNN
ncbi:hypothetical protein [Leuconostoc mesenteroides]|uniref:hypothetical protein n=1 Tax=Leuconostoc mesenteroides TaxID=1245 RepID=UPI0021A39B28|nr:hypothetical protein [Leuconostoc mesenteroides]MCT3053399.1 hypothetical protein [Leuconostoc mesenteroides]